jgi:hypothetical protein
MDKSPPLIGDGQIRAGTSGRAALKQVYRMLLSCKYTSEEKDMQLIQREAFTTWLGGLGIDLTVGIARFAKFFHLSEKNLNPRENPQPQGFA